MPVAGTLSGLFGSSKAPKPKYLDAASTQLARDIAGAGQTELGKGLKDVDLFRTETFADQPIARTYLSQLEDIANLFRSRPGPIDEARTLRDIFLEPITGAGGAINQIIQDASRNQRLREVTAGLTPAITSTAQRLRDAMLGSQIRGGLLGNAYQTIASLFPAAQQSTLARDVELMGLPSQLLNLLGQVEGRRLAPAGAAMNLLGQTTGVGQGVANLLRSLVYGFKQPQNFWDRLQTGTQRGIEELNQMADLYSKVMGGGLVGGGIGSLFGGGAAGGGEMNTAQLMNLIRQMSGLFGGGYSGTNTTLPGLTPAPAPSLGGWTGYT